MKWLAPHHQHKRKRNSKNFEPYPSRDPWVRLLDQVAVFAGVLGPLMTLPQIWQIFYYRSAGSVSGLSWMAFGLLDMPFILYGIIHKDKLICITYILWCTANLTVAVGAIIYH